MVNGQVRRGLWVAQFALGDLLAVGSIARLRLTAATSLFHKK